MAKIYKGIILTIGKSFEPIVHSLITHEVEYAIFICTSSSRYILDKVLKSYLIPPSKYRIFEMEDAPDQIGKLTSYFYSGFRWLRDKKLLKPEDMITDPTPGRKWMSTGAIMMASYLGLDMAYTDVVYKNGKPDKNSMNIVSLGNAYDQTGFLEVEKGIFYFNNYEFSIASEIFKTIKPSSSDLKDLYEGLSKISEGFHKWDLFKQYKEDISNDFLLGREYIERTLYSRESNKELENFLEDIKIKEKIAKDLLFCEKPNLKQIIDLLLNAERRISQGKFDDGLARLYRTLETIEQYYLFKELSKNSKKFDTSDPDYMLIPKQVMQKFKKFYTSFPKKIGLWDGFILLKCLDHKIGNNVIQIKKGRAMTRFDGIIKARNNSILAHGFNPIKSEDTNRFFRLVKQLFIKEIEEIDFEKLTTELRIPKLPAFYKK